ncbi:MAG: hypothetical protein ACYC6Y_14560 [Thermoguttaceae bacterium]
MNGPTPTLVVTLYNERNASVRGHVGGSWSRMLRHGTIAMTGFGYFAERAEVEGFTCYNTACVTPYLQSVPPVSLPLHVPYGIV